VRKWKTKDPADIADYVFDWGSDEEEEGKRFLPELVNIIAATVTLESQPDAVAPYEALEIVEDSFTTKTVTVRLSGGGDTVKYRVTCDVDLNTGEHFQTTNVLPVNERIKK
jgi:hypothetical protein